MHRHGPPKHDCSLQMEGYLPHPAIETMLVRSWKITNPKGATLSEAFQRNLLLSQVLRGLWGSLGGFWGALRGSAWTHRILPSSDSALVILGNCSMLLGLPQTCAQHVGVSLASKCVLLSFDLTQEKACNRSLLSPSGSQTGT